MCRCKHCGFNNPDDVGNCLNCERDLPASLREVKENIEAVKSAFKGDWSKVTQRSVDDFISDKKSSLKYKFHPVWILRVRLFRLKQSAIGCLAVFIIIFILVLIVF